MSLPATPPTETDDSWIQWSVDRAEEVGVSQVIVGAVGTLGSRSLFNLRRVSKDVDATVYRLVDNMDLLLDGLDDVAAELREPSKKGVIERAVIDRIIQERIAHVSWSYDASGTKKAGKVALKFTISASVVVREARIDGDSLGVAMVADCLLDEARQWLFPPLADGSVVIRYPFVFTP